MAEKVEVLITGKDQLTGVLGGIQGAIGGLGKVALGVAAGGVAVLGAGVVGLGALIADSVGEAMAAQDVLAQLDTVLTSTGGAAGVTKDQVLELAGAFQATTKFSDETIISGENMLLTFTNIGKDVFPLATETMLDMSQALGQDLKGSAIQLGKALQDPIQGVTALRRAGVNFSDAQQDIIKSLVETGRLEEAQKFILQELQKEFGGSAEAAGKTFGGQLEILKNKLSDVKEGIGMAVMPVLQKLVDRVITPAIPIIQSLAEKFGDFITRLSESGALDRFVSGVGEVISRVTGLAGAFMETGGALAGGLREGIGNAIQWVQEKLELFQPAFEGIITFIQTNGPGLAATFQNTFGKLAEIGRNLLDRIIPFLAEQLQKITDWANENGPLIQAFAAVIGEGFGLLMEQVAGLWSVIEPILGGLIDLILGVGKAIMQMVTGDWQGAWETLNATMDAAGAALTTAITALWTWITGWFQLNIQLVQQHWGGLWESIKTALSDAWTSIVTRIEEAGASVAGALQAVWDSAVETVRGYISRFLELGGNIIQGVIDGIRNAAGGLIGALRDVIDNAIAAAMAALGISSPSKIFAGIGANMMTGLAQGIGDGVKVPVSAVTGAMGALVSGATAEPSFGAMAGTAAGGGMTVVLNLTYAPALSTASRADVERLMPLIREGAQRAFKDMKRD